MSRTPPSPLFKPKRIPDPYEPMSMGVVANANSVVLGLRDCPDNSENELQFLNLANGNVVQTVSKKNGTSLAAPSLEVGWARDLMDVHACWLLITA